MTILSQNIEAFQALAKYGQFTAAAKHLCITQSALSQRINNLESVLETCLVIRGPRKITLTQVGQDLLRVTQAQKALEDDFMASLGQGQTGLTGSIGVGAVSSLLRSAVMPCLQPLAQANPKIQWQFVTREVSELPSMLISGEIDLVITTKKPALKGLDVNSVGAERNILVRGMNTSVPELYLDHDQDDDTTDHFFRSNGLSLERVERRFFDDIYTIIDAVRLGYGKAVIPRHLFKKQEGLVHIKKPLKLDVPVYLAARDFSYHSRLHQDARTLIQDEIDKFL